MIGLYAKSLGVGLLLLQAGLLGAQPDTARQWCSPGLPFQSRAKGLELSYRATPSQSFPVVPGATHTVGSLRNFTFKLKSPLFISPTTKVLVGYHTQPEYYDIESWGGVKSIAASTLERKAFTALEGRALQNQAMGLYVIQALNESTYMVLRMQVAYLGDYDRFLPLDDRYANYSFIWAWARKPSPDKEWGFGFSLSHNFRRTLPLPFILYNRNFNERWGIEAAFPASVQVRRNFSSGTILLAGYDFNNRNYAMGIDKDSELDPYFFNHAEINTGLTLEQSLVPWVWIQAKAGMQFNISTRMQSLEGPAFSSRWNPGVVPYMQLGLFLSPPGH